MATNAQPPLPEREDSPAGGSPRPGAATDWLQALEGRAVRAPDRAPIYVVERGRRRWVSSPDELARLQIGWNDIEVVPAPRLDEIPLGEPFAAAGMDPRSRLSAQFLCGEGIEIGAAQNPTWVNDGVRVRYVDLITAEENRARHAELRDLPLVEVDVLDDGERLARFEDGSLDFIVANHFLEHTENPLGTLRLHLVKLRPRGVLLYAIPDKRFTFDAKRPLTSFDHLVRDDREGAEVSRRAHYVEFARFVDHLDPAEAERHATVLMEMDNRIHFHVWDLDSLRDFFTRARDYLGGWFDLEILEPNGGEVLVVLRRRETPSQPAPKPRWPSTLAARLARLAGRGRRAGGEHPRAIEARISFPEPGQAELSSTRPYLLGRYWSAAGVEPEFSLSVDGVEVVPSVRRSAPDAPYEGHRFEIPMHAFFDRFDGAPHRIVLGVSAGGDTQTFEFAPTWERGRHIRLVALDTTNTCNLRCAFCCEDQDWKARIIDPEHLRRVRDELLPGVSGTILLSCLNEPFLNKQFHRLCESLPDSEAAQAMFTSNMTIPLSDEKIETLARSKLRNINVSLDSADPETFERMRVNGRFDVFSDNLKRLAAAQAASGNRNLRFSAVVTRHNFRTLPATAEWAAQFEPVEFEFRSLFFGTHWMNPRWNLADGDLDPADVEWLRSAIEAACGKHGIRHVFQYTHPDLAGAQSPALDPPPNRLPAKNPPVRPAAADERRAAFEREVRDRDERVARLSASDALHLLENMLVRVRAEGRVSLNELSPSHIDDLPDLGEVVFEHMGDLARRLRFLTRRRDPGGV